MIQCDSQITEWVKRDRMIEPFEPAQVRDGVISYGLSSFGYDCRTSDQFKVIRPFEMELGEILRDPSFRYNSDDQLVRDQTILDPKRIDPRFYQPAALQSDSNTGHQFIVLAPYGYCLSHSIEYFRIPSDVTVICVGKSTYARSGLVVNVTPLEAGWEGQVTLEFANCTPVPIRVYANEGICQFKFFRGLEPTTTYAKRNGKYQGQLGITLPKL
jgi:dCTP deaminase